MMDRIRKFQILNYQIFSIIDKYTTSLPSLQRTILHIDPPTAEAEENVKPPLGRLESQDYGDDPEGEFHDEEEDNLPDPPNESEA